MMTVLISFLSKISIFVFSILLGMVSYLVVKAANINETNEAQISAHAHANVLNAFREVSLEAKPALLAQTQSPVDVSGDALGVLYILQKNGKVIRVAHGGTTMSVSTRFADLANGSTDADLGFSAIAFHPDFLVKGRPGFGKFYAVVAEHAGTATSDFIPEFGHDLEHHQDVVYEFTTSHPLAGNFKGARREIVRFSQPGEENNLRSLAFDHRGFLYLAIGDGAAEEIKGQSISKNASSMTSAYGKVLRIDPTGNDSINGKYGIPESNPFQLVSDALPELWAFGLRAPHSLSFDPYKTSLCIGESSIDGIEEVNVSEMGGEHFGWDLGSESFFFNLAARAQLEEIVTAPAFALSRGNEMLGGNAGNVIYRGESFPSLAGMLIFARKDGRIMVSDPEGIGMKTPRMLNLGEFSKKTFSALRTAPSGELLVLCEDGTVYEMQKQDSIGAERNRERTLFCAR